MNAPDKIWVWVSCAKLVAADKPRLDGFPTTEYTLTASIPAMIEAAVTTERARCAKIARPNHNGDPCCPCEACHQQRWVADMIEIGPLAAMKGGA